jgi:hypothetical protein
MARGKKGKGKGKGGDDEWEDERRAARKRDIKPSAAASTSENAAGPSTGKKLTRKQLRQQKLAAREVGEFFVCVWGWGWWGW